MRARKKKTGFLSGDIMGGIDFADFLGGTLSDFLSSGVPKFDTEANTPYIAGVTHTGFGNRIPGGFEEWLAKTPEQRFQDSALGKSLDYSTYIPTGTEKMAMDMTGDEVAASDSYWGGLARNIMTGGPMPTAHLPSNVGVEGERRVGDSPGQMGGDLRNIYDMLNKESRTPTQRPLNWSELDRKTQEEVNRVSQESGLSVEEVLNRLRGKGWSGR